MRSVFNSRPHSMLKRSVAFRVSTRGVAVQQGFSLLEVLIAVVILSTVSIMAMRAMSTAVDQTAYLDQKLMASWVAENRLNKLNLALQLAHTPKLNQLSTEQAGKQWVTTLFLGKQTQSITQVEVRVYAKKKEGDPVYRLQAFVPTYLLGEKQ